MATSAITPTTASSTGTTAVKSTGTDSNTLANEDTFMQLLVAQMKNQDPLNPMDGTQYVSQLSQLTSTEQISKMATAMNTMSTVVDNLNTSVLVGQLSSMMGKNVTWVTNKTVTAADGSTSTQKVQHSGVVQGVTISDGTPSLVVKEGSGVTTVGVSDLTLIGNTGLENS
ncbi:flagellar hook assembly protein FlgD [Pectinatus frisingensis]|uniref:flagellar hook assembly protein FlgD n=1 Tax=Pectinatus frisingensis TaxID=865 RepID=UPI0018C5F345|nr:flagellar hook capping FlgD N-terminal domain-containing protein [Pectinatus frisingensis]